MKLLFADRMEESEAGIFSILKQKRTTLQRQGRKIFDMSIGTPDFPPSSAVVEALINACRDMDNYKYAVSDIPELKEAIIAHYKRRFNVTLDRNSVMSVSGSQEGIAHISFALCNPGDLILVPDPGYPIFCDGPLLAGAKLFKYPLLKENNFIIDLQEIPSEIVRKAKAMIVSYPLNPIGVTAPDEFYEDLVKFARDHEIMVIHDNAYSDMVFHGREGKSFLSYKGAMEVGIEFFSLSKSYNLAGARLSFAVGNSEIISRFKRLRSKIDYGIFLPLQHAAIAALNGEQDSVKKQCRCYEERGDKLCQGFRDLGWQVEAPMGSMFVWAQIPENYPDSLAFCNDLMEKTGVICTPGNCFGELGEGYVRFALVLSLSEIEEALLAIKKSGIILDVHGTLL